MLSSMNNHLFRYAQFSTFTHLELLILTQQPVRIKYLEVCVKVDVGGFSTSTIFSVVDMGGGTSFKQDLSKMTMAV